jgi:hypothetical protein
MGSMTPDLTQARRFESALLAGASTEYRLLRPRGTPGGVLCHFGDLSGLESLLARRNAAGWGVYALVNGLRPGRAEEIRADPLHHVGARDQDIISIRAVFVELDRPESRPGENLARIDNAPLPPSLLVRSSSPGRLHAYWLVDGLPPQEFRAVQKALIARFGGDKSVHNPARVMRVPGFWNWNHDPPLMAGIIRAESRRYHREEILEAFSVDLAQHIRQEAAWTPPQNWIAPAELRDFLLAIAAMRTEQHRRGLLGTFRHRTLMWAALNCREAGLAESEARPLVREVAKLLPTREFGPVTALEADGVTRWVYENVPAPTR